MRYDHITALVHGYKGPNQLPSGDRWGSRDRDLLVATYRCRSVEFPAFGFKGLSVLLLYVSCKIAH